MGDRLSPPRWQGGGGATVESQKREVQAQIRKGTAPGTERQRKELAGEANPRPRTPQHITMAIFADAERFRKLGRVLKTR